MTMKDLSTPSCTNYIDVWHVWGVVIPTPCGKREKQPTESDNNSAWRSSINPMQNTSAV